MKGFVQIAQNIVKTVSETLPFSISLSDEQGYIIGDPNPERIGTFHPAYKKVIEAEDFVVFDKEKAIELENVLPGIAAPLSFQNKIIGVLGIIGPPKEVRPYAELTKRYVELMWQETFYRQLSDLEDEMKESYLQYLLLNETKNETRTNQYCKALNIRTDQKTFCIVITLDNFLMKEFDGLVYSLTLKNLKDHLLNEVTLYFNIPQLTRVSFLNKEKIVLLFSISSINEYHNIMEQYFSRSSKLLSALSKHYNSKIYITAGKLTDSIYSIHESYDEAEHLLHQFEQLNSSRQILSYYDWDVLVELLPYKLHESLKSYVLFRLKRIESDKLYEDIKKTFTAYCENGMNITATANHLYVHRNTVIYRLNKLEEIASIDVKNFQHCSLLYLVFKN